MEVRLSLEPITRTEKPSKALLEKMTPTFGNYDTREDIYHIAQVVGNQGSTFCPTAFTAPRRKGTNFREMQLYALDFDDGITFAEVKARADKYNIPIVFAYHTFNSSPVLEKFRVVLLHETPIKHKGIAEMVICMLMEIFPECDPRCKDVARFFCGGKDLFYYDASEPVFNIFDLSIQFYAYVYETDQTNHARRMENFAKHHDIATYNHCLKIRRVCDDGINEENENSTENLIYIGEDNLSSIFEITKGYQKEKHAKVKEYNGKVIKLNDLDKLKDCCRLFADFVEGIQLDHGERFKLMTNLKWMKSGRKILFEYLPLHTENITQWEGQYNYAMSSNYKPESCFGCPYVNECNHKTNMVLTYADADRTITRIQKEKKFYPVTDTYQAICLNLRDAINQKREGIYLISAQTAIGKTSAYLDICKNTDLYLMLVVPTNMLKKQVSDDLEGLPDVYVTPSITDDEFHIPNVVKEEIDDGYKRGIKNAANTVLRRYMKECIEKGLKGQVDECEKYLSMRNELAKKPRIIITTHARLFSLPEDLLRQYTVIVDEDILLTSFQSMEEISMNYLRELYENHPLPAPVFNRLAQIMNTKEETVDAFKCAAGNKLSTGATEFEIKNLMDATSFYVDKYKTKVQYYVPKYMPKGKYIVLSATMSAKLFKLYYPDRYVYEYPKMESEYQGKLIQYTSHSMSHTYCNEHFETVLERAVGIAGTNNIITFKSQTEEYYNKGVVFNDPGLYFGKVAGNNDLKGKDLIVIGTPHKPDAVYKLIGKHLGLDVSEGIHRRRIEYNGFSFNFTTFNNEELREIQLYLISSELEQAIGRARLLRKSCTVFLFSNFPCNQAELIQEEYLEKQ